jgi:hypothetical protein
MHYISRINDTVLFKKILMLKMKFHFIVLFLKGICIMEDIHSKDFWDFFNIEHFSLFKVDYFFRDLA